MEMIIDLPLEFDLQVNLGYLLRDTNECMFEVEGETIQRIVTIGKRYFLIEVVRNERHQLVIQVLGDVQPENEVDHEKIVEYAREWFDLKRDLSAFYELAKNDPLLSKPAKLFYGLRNIGVLDLFEALCWGVLGQPINLTFAYALKRRFVETFGEAIEWNSRQYWIFPHYEKIAKLEVEDLAPLQINKRKSEYIIGIAKLMASGDLSKEELLTIQDFKLAEKMLVKIRGIGPWTANYVLMCCLRYPNAFPVDDVGLINSIKEVNKMDRKPTKEEIMEYALRWDVWKSYATFYLWRLLY